MWCEYTRPYSRRVRSFSAAQPDAYNPFVQLAGLKTCLEQIDYRMDKDDYKELVKSQYLDKLDVRFFLSSGPLFELTSLGWGVGVH